MNSRRGPLLITSASLLFAAMGAVVKVVSAVLPHPAVVFFRNAFGLAFLLPVLWRKGWPSLRTRVFHLHLVRGLSGLGSMYCFFYSIAHLPLAEAVLLNYTMPLFMPLVAAVWLKETLSRNILVALATGFAGVVMILRPGFGVFRAVALVGLAAGLLGAVAQVSIRRLTRSEPPVRIVFYFGLIATSISALPLVRTSLSLDRHLLFWLLLMGMLATGGQLFLSEAYLWAKASDLSPFIYTTVVFAALFDWWVWASVPDRWSLLGGVLICLSGIRATRRWRRMENH